MWPEAAIYIPWDIWVVSWIAAAVWANRTIGRPNLARELPYRILEFGGFGTLLVFFVDGRNGAIVNPSALGILGERFWTLPTNIGWAMVGIASLGLIFSWWARIHLGRLWSGWITRKEDHRIIDTGPYRIVRHPIYTGILIAAFATAAVKGTGHAILGAAMLVAAYVLKARAEERFLREELGAEAYDSYRRRVPMLIPFAPAA